MLSATVADAQTFNRPFISVEAGRQHVIGGSLVDGVDTLQQDTRTVLSIAAGLRGQVKRVVMGGELGVGWMDGDLSRRAVTSLMAAASSSLSGPFHLRSTSGTARADFGDRRTNIEVKRRVEAAAGLVLQFWAVSFPGLRTAP